MFILCVWRKRAHTDGELAPLTLQPWHHLHCLLPFPGSRCSTHWLEASGDDPSSDKHKRALCGPWVCLQCSGSQQVRTVEGGVRRWEGFRGWRGDIVWRGSGWSGGEAAFGDKASVVLPKWAETTLTLWHCELTKIHSHTAHYGALTPSPPPLRRSGERK